MIEEAWIEFVRGIHRRLDPEQAPPGTLADAANVDWSRPYGSVGPRAGSRTLADFDSDPNGGHPSNPLGNNNFDGSAEVLRIVEDEKFRRAYAVVRNGVDGDGDAVAKVYSADLTHIAPGFDTGLSDLRATEDFKIDGTRIPDAVPLDGQLFIATGSRYQNRNIVVDKDAATFIDTVVSTGNTNDDAKPLLESADVSWVAVGSAPPMYANTGYRYRISYMSSKTAATSKFSDAVDSGPDGTGKKIQLVLNGADDKLVFDQIVIWRTTDGGDVFRKLQEVANPGQGSTTTIFDFTPDDRLSHIVLPRRHGRVPSTRFCIAHLDRLLYAAKTDYPIDLNIVYYSEPNAPFNVDPVFNVVQVGANDGGQIVAMFRLYNRVFVCKSNGAIYELADNRPETVYRAVPLVNEGAWAPVSQATIVEIEGVAYWLSTTGVVAFNGEFPRFVSLPIEPIIKELEFQPGQITSVPGDTVPQILTEVVFTFTNNDVLTELFHFRVAFNVHDETKPTPDPDDAGVDLVLDSSSDPNRFVVDDQPFPAGGLPIAPGQQVTVKVFPLFEELVEDEQYFIDVQANEVSPAASYDWEEVQGTGDFYQATLSSGGVGDSAWGQASRFFAVDYWPNDELWLFVKRKGSTTIDTRLVLDYRSLEGEGPPSWRRDVIHATAACFINSIDQSASEQNVQRVILGDANGCVWATPTSDSHENQVHAATPQSAEVRNGAGTIDESGGLWTLTRTDGFTFAAQPAMAGQRISMRDAAGDVFTAVMKSGGDTTAVVAFWLAPVPPTSGAAVDFAIEGMDAFVEFYPSHFGANGRTISPRYFLMRGAGREVRLNCELRLAEMSELPGNPGYLQRLIRRQFTARCGISQHRLPLSARGRWIGFRAGSIRADDEWRLTAWGLAIKATDGRRR
jgi:hypothetical protein